MRPILALPVVVRCTAMLAIRATPEVVWLPDLNILATPEVVFVVVVLPKTVGVNPPYQQGTMPQQPVLY